MSQGHPIQDFIAGVIFVLIGVAAFVAATDYPLGTARRMGPGMFPLLLSGALTLVGVALAAQAAFGGAFRLHRLHIADLRTLRALFFVLLALFAFAVLIRPAGLFLATAATTFVSCWAEPGHRAFSAVVLALVVATLASLVFVQAIGLPIRLWP
ncbi:MAG: tripartite tricarboxylate transporter TctB family protein [Geminicoccaceae bacterium]|nr:MAG: tripartite tricarboxylate transporter TctB family protein [Geminicoccaceae bacterium]